MSRRELRAAATVSHPTGYVCKRCGGAAPVGVGYVYTGPRRVSGDPHFVTVCPCGWSRRP